MTTESILEAETEVAVPDQDADGSKDSNLTKYFFAAIGTHNDKGTLMEGRYNGVVSLRPMDHEVLAELQDHILKAIERDNPHRQVMRVSITSLSIIR